MNSQKPNEAENSSIQRLQGYALRASTPADAEQLAALANMPGVRNGTLRMPFQTIAETRLRLEGLNGGAKEIVADLDNRVIGSIFIGPMQGRRRHAATIGMGVHDEFVGRGVGSALIDAVLDIADNWLGLRRIELTVFTDNESAIRLYERKGFVTEGCLKEFALRDGLHVDAFTMARLRT